MGNELFWGCLGGCLPDTLRLIMGTRGRVAWLSSYWLWISFVVLASAGGVAAAAIRPAELWAAFAIGYSAASIASKLLSSRRAPADIWLPGTSPEVDAIGGLADQLWIPKAPNYLRPLQLWWSRITVLKKARETSVADLNQLVSLLRETPARGRLSELEAILSDRHTYMVIARRGARIVGTGTLYILQKFGKRSAHIEDVVVEPVERRSGIGKAILRRLIELARKQRAHTVQLTSRPTRVAANKLYAKLHFEKNKTNVYRMYL